MNFLKNIEDRWLMVLLSVIVLAGFIGTRDPLLGDVFKVLIGGTITIFAKRSEKMIITGDAEQTKAIVQQFLAK